MKRQRRGHSATNRKPAASGAGAAKPLRCRRPFGGDAMPARTGQQYIDGLREQEREVWLQGERVRDVTRHKGLSGGVKAIAHLYDMQHDAKLRKVMTYKSPSSGERVGRSFDTPKT